MDKKGNAKKIVIVAVISVILLLVAGIVAVSSQSTDSINSSDDSLDIKNAVEKQLNNVAQAGISEAVQKFVEKFVEKRGVNPSDINEVSEVDFAALPEEVQIDNVDDSNLAIYEVDYNETGSGEVNDTKQVFVVTYSAEKLETTQDLIAHPDKRQFLQFGLTDETSGSFLNTAAGVPGSLNQGYVMMRQGSITGISTNLEVSESNDNEDIIDVIIYKNGEAISFGNTLNSLSGIQKDYDIQSKGVVTFQPGDTISVQAVSSNSETTFKNVITMIEITTVD